MLQHSKSTQCNHGQGSFAEFVFRSWRTYPLGTQQVPLTLDQIGTQQVPLTLDQIGTQQVPLTLDQIGTQQVPLTLDQIPIENYIVQGSITHLSSSDLTRSSG